MDTLASPSPQPAHSISQTAEHPFLTSSSLTCSFWHDFLWPPLVHVCVYGVCVCVCVCMWVCVCTHVCTCTCVYVWYVCMCVCVYVCVWVCYIETCLFSAVASACHTIFKLGLAKYLSSGIPCALYPGILLHAHPSMQARG